MHKKIGIFIFVIVSIFFCGCSAESGTELNTVISSYENKEISNAQMLLLLGELYDANEGNPEIFQEYAYRMTVSGYGSKILTDIFSGSIPLNDQILKPIVQRAVAEGNLYELATVYAHADSKNAHLFQPYVPVFDSLRKLNDNIAINETPENYVSRGKYFLALGNEKIAMNDLAKAETINPCNTDAIFNRSLILIQQENFSALRNQLAKCAGYFNQDTTAWMKAFAQLADTILILENDGLTYRDLTFAKRKIYVDFNFQNLALKKVQELTRDFPDNPDYHALEAFIHYRQRKKDPALSSLNQAEALSNKRNTQLRMLIEEMK